MKPSIGRIVIVKNLQSNGSDEHPAIISRVWSQEDGGLINATVFPDGGMPTFAGSIAFFSSREKAWEHLASQIPLKPLVAFPPDRV